MLVGTPLPVILSVFRALGPPLWIKSALLNGIAIIALCDCFYSIDTLR
jgi:hypothetical protein